MRSLASLVSGGTDSNPCRRRWRGVPETRRARSRAKPGARRLPSGCSISTPGRDSTRRSTRARCRCHPWDSSRRRARRWFRRLRRVETRGDRDALADSRRGRGSGGGGGERSRVEAGVEAWVQGGVQGGIQGGLQGGVSTRVSRETDARFDAFERVPRRLGRDWRLPRNSRSPTGPRSVRRSYHRSPSDAVSVALARTDHPGRPRRPHPTGGRGRRSDRRCGLWRTRTTPRFYADGATRHPRFAGCGPTNRTSPRGKAWS